MSDRKQAEAFADAVANTAALLTQKLQTKGFTTEQAIAITAACFSAPNVNIIEPMVGMLGAPTTKH